MEKELRNLFQKLNVDPTSPEVTYGFHLPPYISVAHLHMHGIAPMSKLNLLGRWKFKQNNIRYCTVRHFMSLFFEFDNNETFYFQPEYICENLKK